LARKKPKKTARESAIIDEVSLLANSAYSCRTGLRNGKGKVGTPEKKIDALEEGRKISIDRLEAREEAIGDRDEMSRYPRESCRETR
jgi:hypothetical protein